MPNLPHSRFLQPSDWDQHPARLRGIVEDRFRTAREQHRARKIEYVTALRAIDEHFGMSVPLTAVDVGGDGSPFASMVEMLTGRLPTIVDPASGGDDLQQYLQKAPRMAQLITCLSVLEHVEDLDSVVEDLATLLLPGGLLVLTVDAATDRQATEDRFHFHWMRRRIFCPRTLDALLLRLRDRGLLPVGTVNYVDVGEPWVMDYTFGSLVMYKPLRRRS